MDSLTLNFISAATALVASLMGPLVSLKVAKRQFSANVLSANRQRWIESLRDLIAELVSQIVTVMVVKHGRKDSWDSDLGAASSDPDLLRRIERIVLVEWKIRLLLNPSKPQHAELTRTIERVLEQLKRMEVNQTELRSAVEHITEQSQAILAREWERVKKGV